MPATYLRVPLPAGTAEEEAIEAMLDHSESTGRSLRLHYLGLLTIAVEPELTAFFSSVGLPSLNQGATCD